MNLENIIPKDGPAIQEVQKYINKYTDEFIVMKDGSIEQCASPDEVVLNPATEYVAKFTEEIEKSRVVRARVLTKPFKKPISKSKKVSADATIKSLSTFLVNECDEFVYVEENNGKIIGVMERKEALNILLGEK